MGARYRIRSRPAPARLGMNEVEARDRDRIARINSGDATALGISAGEPRRLKCAGLRRSTHSSRPSRARGRIAQYEQWNIDEASVVSSPACRFPTGIGVSKAEAYFGYTGNREW